MRFVLIILAALMFSLSAHAEKVQRYASIVVDADTLEIIHARQIDEERFPASLTKVMTLYLTFDALNAGTLTLDEELTVSKHAARTSPTKLGLRAGKTITVEDAIQAIAVKSANDMAVVIAERLSGSEENFAYDMTAKARSLGMLNTTFKTPNGLPHPEQKTSARDMAKMAAAVLNNHRRYYHYFGQTHFKYGSRTYKNTNGLLHWLNGVDGFKTGFTRDSGYNLIISAQRDDRRLIAVVLGGASGKSRNKHMQDLIERSFKVMGVSPVESTPPITIVKESVPKKIEPQVASYTEAVRLRGTNKKPVTLFFGAKPDVKIPEVPLKSNWSIQVGAFDSMVGAGAQIQTLAALKEHGLSTDTAMIYPVKRGPLTLYRARFTKLSFEDAQTACKALENLASGCLVIAPGKS